jgi:hypothetical protein
MSWKTLAWVTALSFLAATASPADLTPNRCAG